MTLTTIYYKQVCQEMKNLRILLTHNSLSWDEIDVSNKPRLIRSVFPRNNPKFPLVVIDDTQMGGYKELTEHFKATPLPSQGTRAEAVREEITTTT